MVVRRRKSASHAAAAAADAAADGDVTSEWHHVNSRSDEPLSSRWVGMTSTV